jgi:chorismate mutase
VDADDPAQIKDRVQAMIAALYERNGLHNDDVISAMFTTTPDIRSCFPETAAREWGLTDVALLGAQVLDVDGAVPLCIRVMLHVELDVPKSALQHVFLEGAARLRPDLAKG